MWSYEEARKRFVHDLERWDAGVRSLAASVENASKDIDLRKVDRMTTTTRAYLSSGHELLSKGEWLGQWLHFKEPPEKAEAKAALLTATIAEIESKLSQLNTLTLRLRH